MIDWNFPSNQLILNPRLAPDVTGLITTAWREVILARFSDHIGVLTSGSSDGSNGKLVVLSKAAFLANADAVNLHFQSDQTDVWLKALPDFHVGGLSIAARAHLSGARVVEFSPLKWQAQLFYQELLKARATLLSLVPTQIFDLVQLGLKSPAHLRAVVIGGARLDDQLYARARELGWPTCTSYGLTECASQVATAVAPDELRLTVLKHAQVQISPQGLIRVKSPALLTGMISICAGEMNFVDPKKEGWFETEDRGRLSDDGSLEVFGRAADFVKIGGEGVSMPRLEDRLERLRFRLLPHVDAALLAASDERLGAIVVLVTTARQDLADQIVARFNLDVAPFERIRTVHFVESIPRSPLGKLLRSQALLMVGLKPLANV